MFRLSIQHIQWIASLPIGLPPTTVHQPHLLAMKLKVDHPTGITSFWDSGTVQLSDIGAVGLSNVGDIETVPWSDVGTVRLSDVGDIGAVRPSIWPVQQITSLPAGSPQTTVHQPDLPIGNKIGSGPPHRCHLILEQSAV
jgi:hypothetical protein